MNDETRKPRCPCGRYGKHYRDGEWLCDGCAFEPGTHEAFALGCCCSPSTGRVVAWCPIHGADDAT